MSALTEALVAAQARAINAVSKAYLASHIDRDEANDELQTVGATDDVDRTALLDALDTIKRYGAQAPGEPAANGERQRATQKQLDYLRKLVTDANDQAPTEWIGYLSKDEASKAIEQIKAGSFDINDWQVPF